MGAWLRFRINPFLVLLTLCLVLAPSVAWCDWGADGATIRATTDTIPQVAACTDGGSGTVVVWQQNDGTGLGVLKVQHLLAGGDLDPAWPAEGAVACSVLAVRPRIGAVPDRLGGAYLWWKEAGDLVVKRVDSSGATAAGWPARGRALGSIFEHSPMPCAIEDGAHGIYLAWSNGLNQSAVAIHLGPDNTGAGGWTNYAKSLGLGGAVSGTTSYWPQLALAPDGGVFAAAAIWSQDTTETPSECRLRRLTSAGANASGWTIEGVTIGSFHYELWHPEAHSSLWESMLALSPDARGGLFVLYGQPIESPMEGIDWVTSWLLRLQGDGTEAADWPAGGKQVADYFMVWYQDPIWSYQVTPDGQDGAVTGLVWHDWEYAPWYQCAQYAAAGDKVGSFGMSPVECDMIAGAQGHVFAASYYPTAPYQKYDPVAYLAVDQFSAPTSWAPFVELPGGVWYRWYGDVGLAPTDDGGCVFVWSQVRERFGLFARRFTALGEVTAVEPGAASVEALAIRGLRWVPGAGIRASIGLPAEGPAWLEVYDVAGRRLAGESFTGTSGTTQRTIAGTAGLRAGVYFARLRAGSRSVSGRVVVVP